MKKIYCVLLAVIGGLLFAALHYCTELKNCQEETREIQGALNRATRANQEMKQRVEAVSARVAERKLRRIKQMVKLTPKRAARVDKCFGEHLAVEEGSALAECVARGIGISKKDVGSREKVASIINR